MDRDTIAMEAAPECDAIMSINSFVRRGFCAALMLFAATVSAETVRLTNGEWPPFTSSRKTGNNDILSLIVAEAFALEGVTVEYGYFPWKRAYDYAKSGKWDGSVGWAPTPEHRADFHMSQPVLTVDKGLFYLNSTPFDWKSIDDLRSWRLGAAAGYSYGESWDQAVKQGRLKVAEVSLDEQNIKKLIRGRVDVIAMEAAVASYLMPRILTAEESATVVCHPRLITRTPISLALTRQSDKSPQLLERFDRGLKKLIESGRYAKYMATLETGICQASRAGNGIEAGRQ